MILIGPLNLKTIIIKYFPRFYRSFSKLHESFEESKPPLVTV